MIDSYIFYQCFVVLMLLSVRGSLKRLQLSEEGILGGGKGSVNPPPRACSWVCGFGMFGRSVPPSRRHEAHGLDGFAALSTWCH